MMKYLFYMGHPAHFHLFKNVIRSLRESGDEVIIAIKTKDVLERLLDGCGWAYHNLYARQRGSGKSAIVKSLLVRELGLCRLARRHRPDMMIGTSAEIAHVGRLLRIPSIVVNEDDHDVVPLFASLAYPFASTILSPVSCRMGKWQQKTVQYEGYHELAYLHPNHFKPNRAVMSRLAGSDGRFFLLRFAQLNAHHDSGRKGISEDLARQVVQELTKHGRVYVSSERPLSEEWNRYQYPLHPDTLHDALAFADLYVGDSQTMAAEAAVVGTPSIRFNDFVGQIGYLEELEHDYELTLGIPTSKPRELLSVGSEWARRSELKQLWAQRRERMLNDKLDVAAFMSEFIQSYVDEPRPTVAAA